MTHDLTLERISPVTHDTYHLTFQRPEDFTFRPGQATELTFHVDGIGTQGRPFTMVSQPDDLSLQFIIKSYPGHDGVTRHLPGLTPGTRVTATEPFGAITDQGRGVFLAAGAGITPFISILKAHDLAGRTGDRLIFANKTDADIILQDSWARMPGLSAVHVISDQPDTAHRHGMVDRDMLGELITTLDQHFYICGPGGFVDAMRDALREMGAKDDAITTEEGW